MASISLPPFLAKLLAITQTCDRSVADWNTDGTQFVIKANDRFEKEVLKKHFKGSKSTFIRQLHFYDFKKLDNNGSSWAFEHPKFQRSSPYLVYEIRRKTRTENNGPASKDEVQSLREETVMLRNTVRKMQQQMNSMIVKMQANESFSNMHVVEFNGLSSFANFQSFQEHDNQQKHISTVPILMDFDQLHLKRQKTNSIPDSSNNALDTDCSSSNKFNNNHCLDYDGYRLNVLYKQENKNKCCDDSQTIPYGPSQNIKPENPLDILMADTSVPTTGTGNSAPGGFSESANSQYVTNLEDHKNVDSALFSSFNNLNKRPGDPRKFPSVFQHQININDCEIIMASCGHVANKQFGEFLKAFADETKKLYVSKILYANSDLSIDMRDLSAPINYCPLHDLIHEAPKSVRRVLTNLLSSINCGTDQLNELAELVGQDVNPRTWDEAGRQRRNEEPFLQCQYQLVSKDVSRALFLRYLMILLRSVAPDENRSIGSGPIFVFSNGKDMMFQLVYSFMKFIFDGSLQCLDF